MKQWMKNSLPMLATVLNDTVLLCSGNASLRIMKGIFVNGLNIGEKYVFDYDYIEDFFHLDSDYIQGGNK